MRDASLKTSGICNTAKASFYLYLRPQQYKKKTSLPNDKQFTIDNKMA